MGKYAMHHGVAAATRHFSHKLGVDVSTSTIHSIKSTYKSYIETLKRSATDEGDPKRLPLRKRGRPLLISSSLDELVQTYLYKVRESGGVVNARIVIAAAKGIIRHYNRSLLEEFGGHIRLDLPWA